MNKKGQMQMGMIIMTFISIIVGLVIFGSAIIPQVVSTTETIDLNTTADAGNEVTFSSGLLSNLEGKSVSSFEAYNETTLVDSGNYSLLNNQVSNGDLTAQINCSGEYCGLPMNVSYTYEPVGYITSSGGRSLAMLILVFTALAIAVTALVPTLRSSVMGMMGR